MLSANLKNLKTSYNGNSCLAHWSLDQRKNEIVTKAAIISDVVESTTFHADTKEAYKKAEATL